MLCHFIIIPPPPLPPLLHAGVYFEKYVKGKLAATLWVRNVQLGVFGVPFSLVYAMAKDGKGIAKLGWLQGFDASAWAVIALQVGGRAAGDGVRVSTFLLFVFTLWGGGAGGGGPLCR
jgi:UDP-sugar transporter A1/2/3